MMCYKDMTFCSAHIQCADLECHRKMQEKDTAWLKENDWMPVAWADFSDTCPKFVVKEKK